MARRQPHSSIQARATILERARQQIHDGQGIGHEDFWREMEEEKPAPRPSRSRKKPAGSEQAR
jgi:hypothetical protein